MSVFPVLLLPISLRNIRLSGVIIVAFGLLLTGLGVEASAQSGRRTNPQPTHSPVPSPPASTETPSTNTPSPLATSVPAPRLKLLFARQLTSKHLHSEDVIAASFFKRLSQYANVDCISIGDIKQSKAVARAKSEPEAIVVLLKFAINSYQSGSIILNSPDLEIEYVAFAPRTGKKHAKGQIFFQTIGGGRMQKSGWPNGTPIRITPEGAGIEAAETLFHLLAIKATVSQRP